MKLISLKNIGLMSIFAKVHFSVTGAMLSDRLFDSDVLISVVSAVGGTIGLLIGSGGTYALLHFRAYRCGSRHFLSDMVAMTRAALRGVIAMYALRIPCQFLLQRNGIAPPLAAVIAQALSGIVAGAVRCYHNYHAQIFGNLKKTSPPSSMQRELKVID